MTRFLLPFTFCLYKANYSLFQSITLHCIAMFDTWTDSSYSCVRQCDLTSLVALICWGRTAPEFSLLLWMHQGSWAPSSARLVSHRERTAPKTPLLLQLRECARRREGKGRDFACTSVCSAPFTGPQWIQTTSPGLYLQHRMWRRGILVATERVSQIRFFWKRTAKREIAASLFFFALFRRWWSEVQDTQPHRYP